MKDLIIVCAGGYGLEIYSEIKEHNRLAREKNREEPYNVLGFISDIPDALEGKEFVTERILGTIQDWQPKAEEKYVLGLGTPNSKLKVASLLKSRGAVFETIISPYANVARDLIHGEGCFITSATIGSGVELGSFVNINGSMLYGGCEIGDYSTITGFSVIERAKLGKLVHVGSKAVVTEGCNVGDGAHISAGSVVVNDVNNDALVFGFPAREIG